MQCYPLPTFTRFKTRTRAKIHFIHGERKEKRKRKYPQHRGWQARRVTFLYTCVKAGRCACVKQQTKDAVQHSHSRAHERHHPSRIISPGGLDKRCGPVDTHVSQPPTWRKNGGTFADIIEGLPENVLLRSASHL